MARWNAIVMYVMYSTYRRVRTGVASDIVQVSYTLGLVQWMLTRRSLADSMPASSNTAGTRL